MKNANPVLPAVRRRRGFAGADRQANARVSRLLGAVLLLFSVALVACGGEKAAPGTLKTVNDYFPIRVGEKVVRMQLAVRSGEMQRGLMERRDLGRDDGMLFVYDRPQALQFWMRNTPTPLDIGFFSPEGRLEEIYPLHPFDEKTVGSRSNRLQFALEVHQGWYRENGVKPGAQLDLKALGAALKARGFEPRRFGL